MNKKGRSHTPIRTCIGCGNNSPKPTLIRIAKSRSGELRLDPDQVLEGRGAYLHKNNHCIQTALRTKKFNRAFRMGVSEDKLEKLSQELDQWLTKKR